AGAQTGPRPSDPPLQMGGGLAVPERYTEPMILDLIVSKNLARRQLNAGQKALMALEYEKYYAVAHPREHPSATATRH
ncbi:hypothetical protein, partial [Streptomyces sp. NPDC054829]